MGSARTLLVGGLLVAAAAAALLVLDPFGSGGDGGGRGAESTAAPGEVESTAGADAAGPGGSGGPSLSVPSLEVRGPGAVRVRLLAFKDRSPLADKPVRLARDGVDPVERPTGADGVVLFEDVPAGRDLRLEVAIAPYAPVVVRGIDVFAGQTTTLDDLLLGAKVVLRGHVVDTAGKPVPGAAVAAYTSGGFDASEGMIASLVTQALRFPSPADEDTTDDAGVFELPDLVPGRYRLTAKRSGFAMNHQSDLVVAPDRGAGLLKIVLGPPARVSGRVVDDAGKGVAGATVVALEEMGRTMRAGDATARKDYASTGEDGRYVLDTLTLGTTYLFGVTAPGRAPFFDMEGVVVDAEQERDFVLARGGAVAGRVVDAETGAGVPNARVLVVVGRAGAFGMPGRRGNRGGPPGGTADSTTSTGVATTGADGRFAIEGLRPGPVMVGQAKAPGYATFSASMFPGSAPAWGEVVAGETLEVEARLARGGSVSGRVTSAVDGLPVAGAQVMAMSMMGMATGHPSAPADAEGVYRIEGVPGNLRFAVVATAPGFAPHDPWSAENQLTMPEDGGELERDLVLAAAGTVEGVVTTSRGEPVPGVRVRTRAAPGQGGGGGFGRGAWRQALPGGSTVVLTDAEGRYRIEGVSADGRLVVEATADDVVPTDSAPFEVKAGQTARVDVVLLGAGTLRGRVADDAGRPVAGAWVRAGHVDEPDRALQGFRADALLDPRTSAATDGDGRFELTRLRPGQTLLKVEAEGFVTFYRRDLQVQADALIDGYVVSLSRGESIAGLVRGEDGRPLAGARVVVTRQASGRGGSQETTDGTVEPSLSAVTDARGAYEVQNVPPGAPWNVVIAFAPGHRGFWGTNEETAIRRAVPAGEKNVEFTLKRSTPADFGGGPGAPRPPRPVPAIPPPAPGGMGN